jgi:hypothetical protein
VSQKKVAAENEIVLPQAKMRNHIGKTPPEMWRKVGLF